MKRTKEYLQIKIDQLKLNWKVKRNHKFMINSIENQETYDTMQRGTLKELDFFINGMKLMYDIKNEEIKKLVKEIEEFTKVEEEYQQRIKDGDCI